jgi:FkbM family methyltransferase
MNKQERIRGTLRRAIPKQVYKIGADLLNAIQIIRTNGLRTYLQLHHAKTSIEKYAVIHLKGITHPVHFRPNTPDVNTIVQNLIREEYGQFPKGFEAEWIIDGGGYIGDASVYFLNRFNNCRILTVEPDRENTKLAIDNLANYSNRATLIFGGLWSHKTEMYLTGSYVDSALTQQSAEGATKIAVVDIPTLMQGYEIAQIDILKLDVEGAEEEILCVNNQWLTKTKAVVVEFHGEEVKQKCIESLHAYGFRGYPYRSLYYFLRDDLVP